MIRVTIVTFLFSVPIQGIAQNVVSGKIVDMQQKVIDNVSLSYKRVGSAAILGFTRSQHDGSFKLEIKVGNDVDSLQLDFNHLSYARKSVVIPNESGDYIYVLQEESRLLEDVRVGNVPIFKRKDTINYNVDVFTSKQDRVIADIIKKLPGIEMSGNQILIKGYPFRSI